MKFLYLLYADESKMPAPDSAQMQQQQAAFGAYYDELSKRGMFKGGDPVQPSKAATTVRVRNGSTKTASGPATTGASSEMDKGTLGSLRQHDSDVRQCGNGDAYACHRINPLADDPTR